MKKILRFFKNYHREYFDLRLYVVVVIFLALTTAINYHLDFEDGIIDSDTGTPWKWLWMMLFHGFPFLAVCLFISLFNRKLNWWRSPEFWLKFIFGFAILGLYRSFYWYSYLLADLSAVDYNFLARVAHRLSGVISAIIPIALFYLLVEKEGNRNYYGLRLTGFDPKPYLVILGIAAVFLVIGSFEADIQNYYPKYQKMGGEAFARSNKLPEWVPIVIYETAYGFDFISVELIFRGFLVLAFTRFLGGQAVLAMAATYVFLHYGKPLAEAISSAFGGYILGIISLYTRKIWGGVMIHVGVAWLMEIIGYLQKSL